MRTKLIRALVAAGLVAMVLPATVAAHFPLVDRYAYVSQWYSSSHKAIDIAAPGGTKIVPMRSGRVVQVGWRNDCGGYRVVVYHGNGIYSGYYHMSKVHAYLGEWVRDQTTVIGYVGRSGCASGTHTHLAVWHGFPWASGSYTINPWRWLYADSGYYLPYRYRNL